MKKKTVIFISLLCIICLLIPVILQGCLMLPAMYADNPDLDQQTNDEIKKLILSSVKDLWLIGTDWGSASIIHHVRLIGCDPMR